MNTFKVINLSRQASKNLISAYNKLLNQVKNVQIPYRDVIKFTVKRVMQNKELVLIRVTVIRNQFLRIELRPILWMKCCASVFTWAFGWKKNSDHHFRRIKKERDKHKEARRQSVRSAFWVLPTLATPIITAERVCALESNQFFFNWDTW